MPYLPPSVPMETKLRQFRRHRARLLLFKLNPNPFPHYLTQFPNPWSLQADQVEDLSRRQSPVNPSLSEINLLDWSFPKRLCGPVLEP